MVVTVILTVICIVALYRLYPADLQEPYGHARSSLDRNEAAGRPVECSTRKGGTHA